MLAASLLSGDCPAGEASFHQADFAAAQALLWQCVSAGTTDRTPGLYLTLTYRELKNYQSGLERAESVLKISPNNVDALYLAAFLNFRKADNARSMLLLSRAERLDRGDWRLHQLFALNYSVFNMLGSAELEFQRAIDLNPEDAELRYQLARLYFTQGRYPESIAAANAALAIFPDYPEVHENLGLAYEGSGDVARANASFKRALELNARAGRRDEWPLIDYAMFFLQQGNAQASVPLLDQALQFNRESFRANFEMGRAMRAMGHDDRAESYFEKAVQIEPSDASACFALASVVKHRGDEQRAGQLLARYKLLRQNPNTRVDLEAHAAR